MRYAALFAIPAAILGIATAFHLPDFQPFFDALPIAVSDYIPASLSNQTAQEHDVLKRQYSNTCPTSFINCQNLGAPQLCCAPSAVCSPDAAGHVACCPSGLACSGTIGGVITAGTLNSNGVVQGGAATGATTGGTLATASATTTIPTTTAGAVPTTTNSNGLVLATGQTTVATGGAATGSQFVVASGTTVATPAAAVRAAQIVMLIMCLLLAN